MNWKAARRLLGAPYAYWAWRPKALQRMDAFSPANDDSTMIFAAEMMVEHGEMATEAWRPLVDLLILNDELEHTRSDYLLLAQETRDLTERFRNGGCSRQEFGTLFWHFTSVTMWTLSSGTRAVRESAGVRHELVDAALQGHSKSTVYCQEQLFEAMLGVVSPSDMFMASRWHISRGPDVLSRDYNIAHGLRVRPSPGSLFNRLVNPSQGEVSIPAPRSAAEREWPRAEK